MRTLCQHIFDLAQNSVKAESQNIHIIVEEDTVQNLFKIIIKDDGRGMKPEILSKVKNTFFTTRPRNRRGVGLGIPLMDATCERSGGTLQIDSEYRHGTTITATMQHDNIDRPPLGNLPDLFTSLLLSSLENDVIWELEHIFNGKKYRLKNRMARDELNILTFEAPDTRKKLYQLILKKEKEIHK